MELRRAQDHLLKVERDVRPSTAGTTASKGTTVSEGTMNMRNDFASLYNRHSLPAVYHQETYSTLHLSKKTSATLVNVELDERNKSVVDEGELNSNVVGWESDQDPHIPRNWSKGKKTLNFIVIFLMCILSPFASSVIAPAVSDIVIEFKQVDKHLASFVVSAYVLGYAIGPLLIGPLSEIYGRVIMYHVCNIIFVVFTCMCAVSHGLSFLAAMRFLAGCGGASAFILGPASVADMVSMEKRGDLLALLGLGYNLGPAFAPLLGSHINRVKGWKWIFWTAALMGAFCTIASFLLSETYEPILLHKKAAKLRREIIMTS